MPDTRRGKCRQYIDGYNPEDELNFVEAEECSPHFNQEDCDVDSSPLFENSGGEDTAFFL